MKRNKRYAILLFSPGDYINTDDTVALSSFFKALPQDAKVIWNISLYPFIEEESGLSSFIKERLSSGDEIIPMGYSGTPLHLLTDEEAKTELLWAAHNPWWTGLHDTLHIDVKYYLNPYFHNSCHCSRDKRDSLLFFKRTAKPCKSYLADEKNVYNPAISLSSLLAEKKAVKKLTSFLKSCKKEEDALIVRFSIDKSFVEQQALLLRARDYIEKSGKELVFITPKEFFPNVSVKSDRLTAEYKTFFPRDFFAEKQRALHKESAERTRNILRRLSPFSIEPAEPLKPHVISMDANMQGQINLDDDKLHISFKDGLIADISARPYLHDSMPLKPYLKASSAKRLNISSSFSIDEEGLRGLRTVIRVFDKNAILDMLIAEDFPHLLVDCHIPELEIPSSNIELRLFGIPFYKAHETDEIRADLFGNSYNFACEDKLELCASSLLLPNNDSALFVQVLTPWGPRAAHFALEKDKKTKDKYYLVPVIRDSLMSLSKKTDSLRISLIVSTGLDKALEQEQIPPHVMEKLF